MKSEKSFICTHTHMYTHTHTNTPLSLSLTHTRTIACRTYSRISSRISRMFAGREDVGEPLLAHQNVLYIKLPDKSRGRIAPPSSQRDLSDPIILATTEHLSVRETLGTNYQCNSFRMREWHRASANASGACQRDSGVNSQEASQRV